MGYGKYRRGSRYRGKRNLSKTRIYSKTSAKSQAKQIASLSTAVKKLRTQTRGLRQYGNWKYIINDSTGNKPFELPSATMNIFPLVQPNRWEGIFAGTTDMENSDKLQLTGFNMEMKFIMSNTAGPNPPMFVDVYLVSIKNECFNQFVSEIPNPVEERPYNIQPGENEGINQWWTRNSVEAGTVDNANSNIMLNKNMITVHQHRKFTIGNVTNWTALPENYPVTNLGDSLKCARISHKFRRRLQAGYSRWKTLEYDDINGEDQIFLMVHYDKPTVVEDGLTLSANCVFTGWNAN
ncbi:MAG: putative capsid protein [Cressdnaviricota sp.]|nr:MAG: putative capsid protein [Cressdnaviricota sp.]